MKLYAPESYWKLTLDERKSYLNGCGSQQSRFDFVPDSLLGLSIKEACNIHDFMYIDGKTLEDKKRADRIFLNNMIRILSYDNSILKNIRMFMAYIYYRSVSKYGGPSFWDGKNNDEEMGEVS